MSTSTPFGGIVIAMAARKSIVWPSLLTLLVSLAAIPAALAQENLVYRWVDEEGKVHYNTTLPPEYANRPHQILRNGIVIKTIDDPTAPELTPEQIEQEKEQANGEDAQRERQMRADRLLVLKYRSETEILEAMQVEIDNLAYDSRIIEQGRLSVMTSLTGQIREAADRQRSGLPADPEIGQNIAQLRARLAQGQESRDSLDKRERQIRGLFESELRRYRFLLEGGAPGAVDPSEPVSDTGS